MEYSDLDFSSKDIFTPIENDDLSPRNVFIPIENDDLSPKDFMFPVEDYFGGLPIEIIDLIFQKIGKWRGIAAHVCLLWYNVLSSDNKIPPIYAECLVNSLSLTQWGIDNNCHKDPRLCAHAARNNQLKIIEYLRAADYPWDGWSYIHIVKKGYIEILKYVYEYECPYTISGGPDNYVIRNGPSLCNYAIQNGHLEVFKWLRNH